MAAERQMAEPTRPAEPPAAGIDERDRWWIIVAAALAVFMASVDMSVVNVALPAIGRDLGLPASVTEWVVLAYLLPLAGLALPSGRWLDTVGRRPALTFSLAGFGLSSVAAGLAGGVAVLLAARLAQGMFGALLFSLVPALAATAVRPQARGRAMAVITTVGPLGLISGPALGGVLVDTLGWPWIFFVNVPVTFLVMLIGVRTLPPGPGLRLPDRAWAGEAVLLSTAAALVLLALSFTASHGVRWLLLAGCAVPLLMHWLRVPVSAGVRDLLRHPGEQGPHAALLLNATAIGTVFFLVPYYAQEELAVTARAAGLALLAFPAGMALTGPLGGVLADRIGARVTAVTGAAVFTLGLGLLAPLGETWDTNQLAWRLLLAGCGSGLFNAPNMAMAMAHSPASLMATTGASTNLARTAGFALGPAAATVIWSSSAYGTSGMRAAVVVAASLSAASVIALVSRRRPEGGTDDADVRDAGQRQRQPGPQTSGGGSAGAGRPGARHQQAPAPTRPRR